MVPGISCYVLQGQDTRDDALYTQIVTINDLRPICTTLSLVAVLEVLPYPYVPLHATMLMEAKDADFRPRNRSCVQVCCRIASRVGGSQHELSFGL